MEQQSKQPMPSGIKKPLKNQEKKKSTKKIIKKKPQNKF